MDNKSKKNILVNYAQVLFVFIAFLTMVLVSYFYVSNIVRKEIYVIGEEIMNTTETAVSAMLNESELSFANVTQTVDSMLASGKSNQEILEFLEGINVYFHAEDTPLPGFMKIYGYIREEFLDGSGWVPPEDYSPPSRPWYIGAQQSGNSIFFSEPYVDADTGGIVISFSRALQGGGENDGGILAIDLDLSQVTDYVRNQNISGNGYGVLLSDTLNFTTHRDETLVGVNMMDAGGGYPKLAQMLEEGQSVSAERFTDADGVDSIVFFRTIFNGWHIGVITPRASYYQDVYYLAIVLSILGFVLMLILSALLVRMRKAQMRSDEENQSKSSFLARMSHEMRTPMNAIIGMTDIAKKTDDIQKIHYCLDKIDDASNHLLGVINDVLDMSKIEAGKLELSVEEFSFDQMIDQVVSVMNYKLQEKKQKLTVDIGEDVPGRMVQDRQRLAQVLTNLLSNANKFTPEEGEIGLVVRLTEQTKQSCTLRFSVNDNGIGLSREQQTRLFQSFEQADGSISRKYGGTGLGLAISKRIIGLMNGRIWVESDLGKGSQFIFTIKAGLAGAAPDGEDPGAEAPQRARQASAPPTPAPAGQPPADGAFKGRHLLLAEDVDINREILIELLADTGVSIDCAENGREAVELFKSDPARYDLIFMDIHMPEVDGYEATRQIRALEDARAKQVPIIAMTANVFKEDIEKCLAAGMNDHVGKPIDIDEIIAKMQAVFGG